MSLYTHSAFVRGRGLSQLKSRLKYIKHRLYKGLKPEMTKFSIKFLGQNQRKPQCLCGLSGFGVIITPASTLLTIPVAVPDICLRRRCSLASVDRGHSLWSFHLPPAALPSLPSCFHISFSFYDTFDGRLVAAPTFEMLVRACRGGY